MPKKAAAKRIRITQVRSSIGCPEDQKRTVKALGLKRIRHSVEQDASPAVLGMVFKVKHLVEVDEL